MPTQIILIESDHKPYSISLLVQSLILNVQNSVYFLALPNVACREPIISFVSILRTRNVMEHNSINFPNSMYFHVRPYTLYFGFGYGGIGSVFTMWPPMSNPLTNPTTPSKSVSRIAQTRLVIDRKEPLDEEKNYSKRKHNPRIPQIIPIRKPYHERKGKPSPIRDACRLLISRWGVPINNDGDGPFNSGNNGPLGNNHPKGGGCGLLGGGGSGPSRDKTQDHLP